MKDREEGRNGSEVRWSAYLASHVKVSPLTSRNAFWKYSSESQWEGTGMK